jgi:hypothetical protein
LTGRRGGSAVGCPGTRCEKRVPEGPSHRARRDSEAGATDAASGPPTLTRVGDPATDVTPSGPQGSDWRGGRAGPSTPCIQAARHRAWRVAGVTIWHVRSTRSAAPCASSGSVRQAGPSVAVTRRTSGTAIPGHGKGRLRHPARAAGFAELREGWKPIRGRDAPRLDAQHDSPTLRITGAPPIFLQRGVDPRVTARRIGA